MVFFGDLETFNEVDIKAGAHRYAETVEVLLFPWAIDDGEVQLWDRTETLIVPPDLKHALKHSEEIVFHNSGFDRTVLRHQLPDLCPPVERWHDTMVRAYSHSLPGALDTLCDVFHIDEENAKQKRGRELVLLFCKPRPKQMALRRATRETHPKEWEEFREYAKHDILGMRAIYKKMPRWNWTPREKELWVMDQRSNDRGITVDTELAKAAIRASEKAKLGINARVQEITEYDAETGEGVDRATRRDAMLRHVLESYGVSLPDMKAATLEKRIRDESLPVALRELLALRLDATTTSVSKYKALIRSVSSDGKLRGTKQFRGAARTGRFAGRLFQPDNMPRPTLKAADIEFGIRALKADLAPILFDNVMKLCSSAVRGCIIAPPGKKLCVADLSNIEGRILAWLSGEAWKLQAFRDFDTIIGYTEKGEPITKGWDLYALAYAKSFAVSPEAVMDNKENGDGSWRQIGKVMELALGYEGGVGAFVTFALAYNIDLDDMAEKAWPNIPQRVRQEAAGMWEWAQKKRRTLGLKRETFMACDAIKRLWREAHPETASWWKELGQAFRKAVENPGMEIRCRRVTFIRNKAWLRIILPSGRSLCYPSPQVDVNGDCSYMGVNQYTRKWTRIKTYSGKIAENITQAVAADKLLDGYDNAEKNEYEVVLSVHDELIAETPDTDEFSHETLADLMAAPSVWDTGLPLAAAGFTDYRYRKG